MQMLLKKYGLEPVRDVPIIQIGGLPELAAGLSNKSIYAAAMSYPMGLGGATSRDEDARQLSQGGDPLCALRPDDNR